MTNHPWIQTSPNTYSQTFGFMERFFTRFLGEEGKPSQFTIVATLELRIPSGSNSSPISVLESNLRSTWRAMRYYSPGLATLTGPTGKIYHVAATPAVLEKWEAATFIRHPEGTQAEALFSTLTRANMVTMHFLPCTAGIASDDGVHQLVLQAEHHHIDGRGVYYFLHRFLTFLSTPELRSGLEFGDEWTRLPTVMDDLLELSATPTAEELDIAREWISPVLSSNTTPVTVPIRPKKQTQPPGRSLRSALRLSRAQTSAIITACKAHGVTVTSAWTAGLALALSTPSVTTTTTPALTTFATVDMRRYFPPPTSSSPPSSPHPAAPVSCYHSAIPLSIPIPATTTFTSLAAELTALFHGGSITPVRNTAWIPFVSMMGDIIASSTSQLQQQAAIASSGILISSLGVVNDYIGKTYGEVEVRDVWIGDVMMGGTSLWMCETWDGRLGLSVTYNEAYYEEGEMTGVLERVKGVMVGGEGLGLE